MADQRIATFDDLNTETEYNIRGEIVQGFSVTKGAATTDGGIALIGEKPQYSLKLWVGERWWHIGEFETKEEAHELGNHILLGKDSE